MHPFAKQLLSWQAGDPEKRAAALMLEVKGDFCHDLEDDMTRAEISRATELARARMASDYQDCEP